MSDLGRPMDGARSARSDGQHWMGKAAAGGVAIAVWLTGCSSGDDGAGASSASGPSVSAGPTSAGPEVPQTPSEAPVPALDRWRSAYNFLWAQTKWTEVSCTHYINEGGAPNPVPEPVRFYDFADRTSWQDHLITRKTPFPEGTFELCGATVPTTVPYGAEVSAFLRPFGLYFAGDPSTASDELTPIEISYAGQNGADPDIIYRNEPGLFGLRLALLALGDMPFVPDTSEVAQPADEATAAQYLQFARPLLDWYGYKD